MPAPLPEDSTELHLFPTLEAVRIRLVRPHKRVRLKTGFRAQSMIGEDEGGGELSVFFFPFSSIPLRSRCHCGAA